jgi:hypothetical protein
MVRVSDIERAACGPYVPHLGCFSSANVPSKLALISLFLIKPKDILL